MFFSLASISLRLMLLFFWKGMCSMELLEDLEAAKLVNS